MVLLFVVVDDDLLEGMADVPELEVLDFSSLPELVPSDWESEESTREKNKIYTYLMPIPSTRPFIFADEK